MNAKNKEQVLNPVKAQVRNEKAQRDIGIIEMTTATMKRRHQQRRKKGESKDRIQCAKIRKKTTMRAPLSW
jgi:hypothetical protein